MLGECIALYVPTTDGEDPMGDPVIKWERHEVEGALVRPKAADEPGGEGRAGAVQALYSVALPKSFTKDMPRLANGRVSLVDRGMPDKAEDALLIVGDPDRTAPCPTLWDVLFDAGRVYG